MLPILSFIFLAAVPSVPGQQITTVATYHNIGISVTFPSPVDSSVTIQLAYKKAGAPGPFQYVHPLSRISDTSYAGSVFQLQSGTACSLMLSSGVFANNQIITAATLIDTIVRAAGTVYHVSPGGSDAATGLSLGQAFATLAHAMSVAQPGQTVLLHSGRYHEEITLPRSGSANAPIVIRNAPGETAILDGRDTSFHPAWSVYDAANHIYRSPAAGPYNTAFWNSGHLFCYSSLANLISDPWEVEGSFFSDANYIYVRLPGGIAPSAADTVTVPAFTTAITCQRNYIQFTGLEVCYYGNGDYSRGIYFYNGSYNLVDSCFFHHNLIGVALKYASDFNTVQRCRFTEAPIDTWPWEAVKSETGYYEAGGVNVYGSTTPNRGNVVRNNHFYHMFDGSHIYSDPAPTTNFDFYGNVVELVNDDCLETDGAGSNVRIYGNRFRRFLTGVSVAPAAIGPTYIFRNLFTEWETHGAYSGYPVKFNVTSSLSIDWVYLYHNTCITGVAGQNGFWFKQYSNWRNIISRNNIYSGTYYALESSSSQNPVYFDYDDLYTSHATRYIYWGGTSYSGLPAFSAAAGQEAHGKNIQPAFADTTAGDYRLAAGSSLLDAGLIIPGINDSFGGAGPDLGAFETGVSNQVSLAPVMTANLTLEAWPSPARQTVTFRLAAPAANPAVLSVFDLAGRTVFSAPLKPGQKSLRWNTRGLAAGLYLCRLHAGPLTLTKKIVLLK